MNYSKGAGLSNQTSTQHNPTQSGKQCSPSTITASRRRLIACMQEAREEPTITSIETQTHNNSLLKDCSPDRFDRQSEQHCSLSCRPRVSICISCWATSVYWWTLLDVGMASCKWLQVDLAVDRVCQTWELRPPQTCRAAILELFAGARHHGFPAAIVDFPTEEGPRIHRATGATCTWQHD